VPRWVLKVAVFHCAASAHDVYSAGRVFQSLPVPPRVSFIIYVNHPQVKTIKYQYLRFAHHDFNQLKVPQHGNTFLLTFFLSCFSFFSSSQNKLSEPEVLSRGWLLDGYPRSGEQAEAIEAVGIRPDLFLLINVPDAMLVERVVGRRSDPETGEIYHLTFKPPPPEIIPRLVQRSDDTEEKCKARLETYHKHVEAVVGYYQHVLKEVQGDRSMDEVFGEIEDALNEIVQGRQPKAAAL
jgi:adenylate kinase family enzyme